jgi:protein SCO1/2
VARHPAAATSPRYTKTSERPALQRGDRVPAFTLSQDQNGEAVHLSDYEGDVLVLTFIYTRCPIPDYCPLMSKNFAQLQDMLPPALQDDVHLLSVSFDPERDTPPVLRDYAQRYTDDLSNWTFATGTEAEVRQVTDRFGVFTEQEEGQIVHSLRTALIGPDGRVRALWRGNDWAPQEVLAEVKRVTGG